MSRRLFPTLADYVIVAINPALVMTLVGSLVYFLLELLYQGHYPERLQFSLTMFVFAIVLISRIAMEEGFEHAAPFGIALAVVVGLAMQRFVDYGQGALAHFGWLVNWGLMALSWWCAHQLTWDCTVIDESEESEGQGLLETVGIDRATGEVRAAEQNAAQEAATADAGDDSEAAGGKQRKKNEKFSWERILNRKDRVHAPGVWIVYFSLAALPIFGIGQAFIPAANAASRRYVFVLFVVYVASGLGLLLTTSFLALRRYLRQRHLEMPTQMVGNWLLTGVVLIVALLALVALLPRPNAEFAISQVPWFGASEDDEADDRDEARNAESENAKSSSHSVGQEGTRDKQATTGGGADHARDAHSDQNRRPDQNSQGGKGAQPGGQAEASGQRQERSGEKGDSSSKEGQQSSQGGQGGAKGKRSGGDGKASPNEKGGGSDKGKSDSGGGEKSQDQASGKGGGDSKDKSKSAPGEKKQDSAQEKQSGGGKPQGQPSQSRPPQSQPAPPRQPPVSTPSFNPLSFGFLGDLLKWLFYGGAIAGVAYLGWRHWELVRAFLEHWRQQWIEFWNRILGRSPPRKIQGPQAPLVFAPPPRPFSDYGDPFALGTARGFSQADLVKYTFAALEAWARDRGQERQADETPHEFARLLGARSASLAPDVRSLADMYCRIVYAPGAAPPANREQQAHRDQLRRLWQTLRSLPLEPAPAASEF